MTICRYALALGIEVAGDDRCGSGKSAFTIGDGFAGFFCAITCSWLRTSFFLAAATEQTSYSLHRPHKLAFILHLGEAQESRP